MNINELRIGNLIYEIIDTPENPEEKEIFKISVINSIYGTLHDRDDNITQLSYCEPIPLTKEWLVKFGFEKEKDELSYCDDGEYTIKSGYFTVFKNDLITHNSIHGWYLNKKQFELNIKYVHQLQNLYFALTGNELEIKW